MGRAPCCDKANVKRGPWSPEEDATLKSYIEKHGTGGNWIALPHKIGLKRCGKSCRLRWLNYLRPNIKHGGFTEDEDNLICSLYISIGSRWSIIAAQLPGRTDNDIKNYWNTKLKKKLLGRHRREQRETSKRGAQNYYSNSQCNFSLYNQLPQPVDFLNDISIMMPPLEARFYHDHPQTNSNGENTRNSSYTCDVSCVQNQHLCYINSTSLDFEGISSGVPANEFQAFDEIQEDIMYRMPQLDGLYNFSAVDMVNCSTVSPESAVSWGGMSDHAVHPSGLSSYQVRQIKMPQDSSFFDQPRLLGHCE